MGSASASVMTTSLLALALAALAFVSRAAAQGNGCSSVMMTLAPCMDFISSKASEPGISCCSVLAGVRQRRKKPTQLQMPLQQMEPQAPQTQRMQRAYCFSSAHCCMPSNKW
ncbi:Bifunctional inhibitor/lipid-transfer protein/seed storage 2S albumin superfamily protein [Zea mays]|uniref:Bifunctional inhibitor/lipid-transfer protein/seed storage 2S albumin superfamily protein n=1 Tax=Zea mays TaxID=4577 RepID=A0A1D6HTB4_MAIZE|nr:Bifunctional inhibitor/lipid-transfer protein/seed storage 2S albumin superfamily protein [Zea mays]ONM51632.1 Bifunctional inhibitor/lipid-transfer protein/seed storage 2S albumin superfamily protein [Zea mays]ONM51635.1 Bifunctional inhibitor/lipid-transfer protein/seed storage 2S albumin superfamily protein [Zea mays]ONM51637.1 Bifunctional inhibitor/lipid-transfer protein/seed storage 2S albumin superfamily protein [Zea mays]